MDDSSFEAGDLGPVANRIYETSVRPVLATFAPSSVVLAVVPPDGWLPVFGRGRSTPREAPALAGALARLGTSAEEAKRLSAQVLHDWEAIEIPRPRSRREELHDLGRFAALAVRLLAATPRFAWRIIRGRDDDIGDTESSFVPPGSSEYGVIRVLKTSRGWAQFEFWGGPQITAGVYRGDGWLPMSRLRRELDGRGLVEALRTEGLPAEEAEQAAALVLAERQARLRGESEHGSAGTPV